MGRKTHKTKHARTLTRRSLEPVAGQRRKKKKNVLRSVACNKYQHHVRRSSKRHERGNRSLVRQRKHCCVERQRRDTHTHTIMYVHAYFYARVFHSSSIATNYPLRTTRAGGERVSTPFFLLLKARGVVSSFYLGELSVQLQRQHTLYSKSSRRATKRVWFGGVFFF